MKCFYHSADLDGKCSAAIVHFFYPLAGMVPINYGEPFPWEIIGPDELIYMVDFSLQPFEDMLRLNDEAKLVWIDHHASALNEQAEAGVVLEGIQRDGLGACALVWEYFSESPAPEAVRLLAEYDVWNHSDDLTLPFQYGMRELDIEPDNNFWPRLFEDDTHVETICEKGAMILSHIERQNAIKARTLCFETEMDSGLKLLAANIGLANSQLFDSLWDPEKYDAMCTFHWRPKVGTWSVSLYSTREDIDVGAVCKELGGGGHKGAAGFQCRSLPFPRTSRRPILSSD